MDILVLNKIDVHENNIEEIKKHLDGLVDTILFQDESMIRDYKQSKRLGLRSDSNVKYLHMVKMLVLS